MRPVPIMTVHVFINSDNQFLFTRKTGNLWHDHVANTHTICSHCLQITPAMLLIEDDLAADVSDTKPTNKHIHDNIYVAAFAECAYASNSAIFC